MEWTRLVPGSFQSPRYNKSFPYCRPDCSRPGLDLPRCLWVLLNDFRTGKGHCASNHHTWGLTDDPLCSCGQVTTTDDVPVCPSTKFPGGLRAVYTAYAKGRYVKLWLHSPGWLSVGVNSLQRHCLLYWAELMDSNGSAARPIACACAVTCLHGHLY